MVALVAAIALMPVVAAEAPPKVERVAASVTAELQSDTAVIAPGKPFTLGVLIQMKPGWHVYWKYPGDAGQAVDVKFIAPQGFTVGPVLWPAPKRFEQPGGVAGYGYAESVLLMAKVTPPKSLAEGAEPNFRADVNWVACEKTRGNGSASVEIVLPAAAQAVASPDTLFARWEQRLPVEATAPASPFVAKVTGMAAAEGPSEFTIDLEWKKQAPAGVEWFPAVPEALKVAGISVATAEGKTRIRFTAEPLKGLTLKADTMESVVACTDGAGGWRGVRVVVPLVPSAAK